MFLTSTQKLYEKMAKEEAGDFVVPAFNLRTLTFDSAKALFRAAKKENAGAFIFELAPTEAEYTNQSPKEFKKNIFKAAKAENFDGPIFLQGDHFKVKNNDLSEIKKTIKKFIKAGFYNIDLDCSYLSIEENVKIIVELSDFIRKNQPKEIEITIGGEVGVIGEKNTTLNEFQQFLSSLQAISNNKLPIIKVAIQSGTTHGGIMNEEGKIEVPQQDFELIKQISQEAKKHGLAGVVQHGASTLPNEYFSRFLEIGVCEIHLATIFQNMVYDSQYFPADLKEKIYNWLRKEYVKNKKDNENDVQFIYQARKRGLGKFKKQINKIPQENIDKISEELEEKFRFFMRSLKVSGTAELIKEIYGTGK